MERPSSKGQKKNFVSKDVRRAILDDYNNSMSIECIAEKYNLSVRHANDIIKRGLCNSKFTNEESMTVITMYINGSSASQIARVLPNKVDWMVRNYIKTLPPVNILSRMIGSTVQQTYVQEAHEQVPPPVQIDETPTVNDIIQIEDPYSLTFDNDDSVFEINDTDSNCFDIFDMNDF